MATPKAPLTVTVKPGNTLSGIAKATGSTVAAIAKANNITNVNLIKPGQVFTIPGKTTTTSTTTTKPEVVTPGLTPEQVQAMIDAAAAGSKQDALLAAQQQAALDAAKKQAQQVDSIAAITALLKSYGIGDLAASITEAVQKGYSSDTITLMMQDPNGTDPLSVAYQKRFSANKLRAAAGKAVLSPSEYLAAEKSYSQVLQSYGVANLATQDKLSSFIANDVSATEVADRVSLAINRVQNADPQTKAMLKDYYPMLNQTDIIGAVLDPAEGLPALQRKVQIAEIGGAALAQGIDTTLKAQSALKTGYEGLTTTAMGAEELANLGLTKAQAQAGFQQVAEVLPRATFLSSISQGEDYTRTQAEQEAFQGLASAKRARMSLTEQEKARFGGSSGVSKSGLASQKGGLV